MLNQKLFLTKDNIEENHLCIPEKLGFIIDLSFVMVFSYTFFVLLETLSHRSPGGLELMAILP